MYTLLEFDEVDSTSSLLKEHYASFPHFTIVRADYQKHGRGQFGRTWDALPHQNLLMSILLKDLFVDEIDAVKHKIIDVLIDVLRRFGIHAFYQSPNDLFVGNNKICGMLIETKTNQKVLDYMIIGIGLNVNQTTFGPYPATSMACILSKKIDIKTVFEWIINELKEKQL